MISARRATCFARSRRESPRAIRAAKEKDIDTPTPNRKKGKMRSVGVAPCQGAWREGGVDVRPAPRIVDEDHAAIASPRNASREATRPGGDGAGPVKGGPPPRGRRRGRRVGGAGIEDRHGPGQVGTVGHGRDRPHGPRIDRIQHRLGLRFRTIDLDLGDGGLAEPLGHHDLRVGEVAGQQEVEGLLTVRVPLAHEPELVRSEREEPVRRGPRAGAARSRCPGCRGGSGGRA